MDNFEEEVQYFVDLFYDNMQLAKTKKGKKSREEAIFHNLNIKLDGQEVAIWNKEKDWAYILTKKEIQEYSFKYDLTKYLALKYMDKLDKYSKNEISFEEVVEIRKETNPIVKRILAQKNNISEQIKLLHSNRKTLEVQEYIQEIYNDKNTSKYVKYLIDKYYYNKKNLIKPEKNGLERGNKIILK